MVERHDLLGKLSRSSARERCHHRPNRRPVERARRFDGIFPIAANGDPLQPDDIADLVAQLDAPPGFDVVSPWAAGVPATEYEAAGATWLVDSRWPEGGWLDALNAAAARGPNAVGPTPDR